MGGISRMSVFINIICNILKWTSIPSFKKIMPWNKPVRTTQNAHDKCCIYNLGNPVVKITWYLRWYLTEVCLPNTGRGLRREGDSILHPIPSHTFSSKQFFFWGLCNKVAGDDSQCRPPSKLKWQNVSADLPTVCFYTVKYIVVMSVHPWWISPDGLFHQITEKKMKRPKSNIKAQFAHRAAINISF